MFLNGMFLKVKYMPVATV